MSPSYPPQFREYLICQERGHESNGNISGIGMRVQYECKYCGVHYYFEPQQLVEIDPPKTAAKEGEE